MKQIEDQDPINFTNLSSQLLNYHQELQLIITKAKDSTAKGLQASL